MDLRIYSDGASRGNPGPSAIAFMILTKEGKILKTHSECTGVKTNNQAEYTALIAALESASKFEKENVEVYLDSELLVKQVNGEYKVRNKDLKTLWLNVQKLRQEFACVTFTHIPRSDSYIQRVDKLVNNALDGRILLN